MLLLLAAALYMLPDGSFYAWRLYLHGAFARLERPPDPRLDVSESAFSTDRDLLDILSQKNAEIAELNRQLRELGVTREFVPRVKAIPARTIQLGPNNNLDAFTIDVGSIAGVKRGQAVVVGQALVGIVVRVEANASLVLSLSSPGCYISVRLGEPGDASGKPRILAAAQGIGGNQVKTIVFSTGSSAQEGWQAMTSGLEKAIPEGLLVGTVVGRFTEGQENGTMEAELRPELDLSTIDFVTVLSRE